MNLRLLSNLFFHDCVFKGSQTDKGFHSEVSVLQFRRKRNNISETGVINHNFTFKEPENYEGKRMVNRETVDGYSPSHLWSYITQGLETGRDQKQW